jgi:uroporphyrinogen-III synthase
VDDASAPASHLASLRGRRVVTTRDEPGELDLLLVAAGADVLHVPLIEIVEPADGGAALRAALARLDSFDWLVVTSRHGAKLVGTSARAVPVHMAAVGTATARVLAELSERPVDLVPERQQAAALVDAFPDGRARVLIAQADRADATLADGLRAAGHHVETVVAYATRSRVPSEHERAAALAADAVAFASGSAALAWADAIGTASPPVVCAIGPSTAAAATRAGLKVTAVAADHSVPGLVELVTRLLA